MDDLREILSEIEELERELRELQPLANQVAEKIAEARAEVLEEALKKIRELKEELRIHHQRFQTATRIENGISRLLFREQTKLEGLKKS
jgi:hypothetical protein